MRSWRWLAVLAALALALRAAFPVRTESTT
jgi:hypothetical protein